MDQPRDLGELTAQIANFAKARDWEKFHTPRNLVLALAGEIGELAAEFQWVGEHEVLEQEHIERVSAEIADVAIYLFRLADVLGINLGESMVKKIQLNETRYPESESRGSAAKYNAYE